MELLVVCYSFTCLVSISWLFFWSWNAFGESTQGIPNNLFAFNTMSQVAPHQSSVSGAPYVGPRTAQVHNFLE
jgi:hypothetical protein